MKKLLGFLPSFRWGGGLRACFSALPVLRTQLREMSGHVEHSVVTVCRNFNEIAAKSRKAVAKAAELMGGDQENQTATVEQSIETSRTAIADLLQRLERSTAACAQVVSSMEQVEQAMGGTESLLAEVEKIGFANQVVALNAKIEAVHVGSLGSGFEVVADEISRQAGRSKDLAEGIGERIREMRQTVNGAISELRTFIAEDREMLAQSRSEAERALDLLWSVHQRGRDSLALMSAESNRLAEEVASAVMTLQFQDRFTQRVAHVIEALENMEHELGGKNQGQLLKDMHAAYTMQDERTAMARALKEPAAKEQEGDIELF